MKFGVGFSNTFVLVATFLQLFDLLFGYGYCGCPFPLLGPYISLRLYLWGLLCFSEGEHIWDFLVP